MTKRRIRLGVSGIGLALITASLGYSAGSQDKTGRGTPIRTSTPTPVNNSRSSTEKRVNLKHQGRTYPWYPDRTVIAMDIDGTISTTNYFELAFSSKDRKSRPIRGSVEVLTALAREYNIVYVTVRSQDVAEKTREWLARHNFPSGPLVCANGVGDWNSQTRFKTRTFAQLRQWWPNLLIGIGDRSVDVNSCCGNGMLSMVVNEDNPDEHDGRAVVLQDWAAIGQYFARNRSLLTDPASLATSIDRNGRLKPSPDRASAAR